MPEGPEPGGGREVAWSPDAELDSYETYTIELPDLPTYAGEQEHSLCATLIRRNPPRRRRAMLYIHGWDDYFFQRHLADEMFAAGYDFYAIDLHRYGRSLREGQLAGFTHDLDDYFGELGRAAEIIAGEGHDGLVVMGHSTGGLIASLWVAANPGVADAVVLNSPWLELQSYSAARPAIASMLKAARQVSSTAVVSLADGGLYHRAISSAEEGHWDYNLNLKGDKAFVVRVGWLLAVMAGHARVAAGLDIDVPVYMAISAASDFSRKWSEELRTVDLVLDVERLATRAHNLGRHVTLVRVKGGMHDLTLSDEPARSTFFEDLRRWLAAYG